MTDQTVVLAAYPSARADQRAPRHVAIFAIVRVDGKRVDQLIGAGTTEALAWQCAAERVREDNAA
jgi:hypothetical protein